MTGDEKETLKIKVRSVTAREEPIDARTTLRFSTLELALIIDALVVLNPDSSEADALRNGLRWTLESAYNALVERKRREVR